MARNGPKWTCDEFLVSAVRYLRKNRNELPGVRLIEVYKAALETYGDTEIRRTLNTLLKNHRLVVVAHFIEWGEDQSMKNNRVGLHSHRPLKSERVVLGSILKKYPLETTYWRFDAQGKLTSTPEEQRTTISEVFVYVVADGLPKNVRKLLSPKLAAKAPPTVGERILEWMELEHRKNK